MLNFKTTITVKIVSLIITCIFLFTNITYGIDLPNKSHLRPNLLGSSEEGEKRLKDGLASTRGFALKDIGDEDAEEVPEETKQAWRNKTSSQPVETKEIKGLTIIAKFITDDERMPEGMSAYHLYDNEGNLIIVTRSKINPEIIDEAIYHEAKVACGKIIADIKSKGNRGPLAQEVRVAYEEALEALDVFKKFRIVAAVFAKEIGPLISRLEAVDIVTKKDAEKVFRLSEELNVLLNAKIVQGNKTEAPTAEYLLANTIGHYFRSVVTPVRGFSQFMASSQEILPKDDRTAAKKNRIKEGIGRLRNYADVLTIMPPGLRIDDYGNVDLNNLVAQRELLLSQISEPVRDFVAQLTQEDVEFLDRELSLVAVLFGAKPGYYSFPQDIEGVIRIVDMPSFSNLNLHILPIMHTEYPKILLDYFIYDIGKSVKIVKDYQDKLLSLGGMPEHILDIIRELSSREVNEDTKEDLAGVYEQLVQWAISYYGEKGIPEEEKIAREAILGVLLGMPFEDTNWLANIPRGEGRQSRYSKAFEESRVKSLYFNKKGDANKYLGYTEEFKEVMARWDEAVYKWKHLIASIALSSGQPPTNYHALRYAI